MIQITAFIKKIANGLKFHVIKMKCRLQKSIKPKLPKQQKRCVDFNADAYEQLIVMKINRDENK